MQYKMQHLTRLLFVTTMACCLSCDRSGLEVIPVSGHVSFEGREQPAVCRLTFLPVAVPEGGPLRPSVAEMKPDGSYQVTPFLGTHGLLPGTYRVRVAYYDLKPGADPDMESSWIEHRENVDDLVVNPGSSRVEHDVIVRL